MPLHGPPRRAATGLGLALVLAACGTVAPTSTPSPVETSGTPQPPASSSPTATAASSSRPTAEVFAEIRAAVEQIRGLQPVAAVDPVTIDEAQLRRNLEAEFDATYTPEQVKESEELLMELGLIPIGSSLRQLTLDLQAGQVAGYYSPERDALFVVNRTGVIGPVDEATYAHEFTHQLQDQRFNLDALGLDATDQSDRSLGRLGLVEGDATSVQTTWMTTNLTAAELGELLRAALDPQAIAALNNAPAYLRDTATFPYQDGFAFVGRLLANGGYAAVDAAFADPPDSSEQILHPEKYLAREAPIQVGLPKSVPESLGTGWSEAGRDTLGELILRIWLTEGGVPAADARTAAAGWGGDRLALYRGPAGAMALLLRSEWDTAADAAEFAAAARTALARLIPGGLVRWDAGKTTVEITAGFPASNLVPVTP